MNPYHEATDDEVSAAEISGDYELLCGPNGFECFLGEPEDRRWGRDANAVVVELNRLHDINADLLAACERALMFQSWKDMLSDEGRAASLLSTLDALREAIAKAKGAP